MAYEAKPGSFSLFKNQYKDADNKPDYKGDGKDLDGNVIEVAAWLKEGANGKFMSCTFKLKEARPQAKPAAPAAKQAPEPRFTGAAFDDEIPFAKFHAD